MGSDNSQRRRGPRHYKALGCGLLLLLALALQAGLRVFSVERQVAAHVATMDGLLAQLEARAGRAWSKSIGLPVYVVNMDEHRERLGVMRARLGRLLPPMRSVRVRGVDGRALIGSAYAHSGFEWASPGELGCTLSHLAAAARLVKDGHAAALVLEDDAHLGLLPIWPLPLPELVKALPPRWSTLQLYHGTDPSAEPPLHGRVALAPYDLSARVRSPGTVAYLLSQRGARALLALTRNGTAVHAAALRTRDGRADTVMFEYPGAAPFLAWPRYVLPYNGLRASASTIHARASRHHLWHVRVAAAILQRAIDAWGLPEPLAVPTSEPRAYAAKPDGWKASAPAAQKGSAAGARPAARAPGAPSLFSGAALKKLGSRLKAAEKAGRRGGASAKAPAKTSWGPLSRLAAGQPGAGAPARAAGEPGAAPRAPDAPARLFAPRQFGAPGVKRR